MNVGIEDATLRVVMDFLDAGLRRSEFLALPEEIEVPATAGYDELFPIWDLGLAAPRNASRLRQARPRPPSPDDSESQFKPADIAGGPDRTGTGYAEIELLEEGNARTTLPGIIPEVEQVVIVRHHVYTPKDSTALLRGPYTGGIIAMWRGVFLDRSLFDPFFPSADVGIFYMKQEDDERMPKRKATDGVFDLTFQDVALRRRSANVAAN